MVPSLGELGQDRQHLRRHLRVERAGHLVEQQIARLHGQRPADADALALAAGELRRIGIGAVAEADRGEQRPALGFRFGARPLQHLDRRQRDVLQRRHVRIEVEELEHRAGALARLGQLLRLARRRNRRR